MYTQLHIKFDGYCLKKSVINGLQLFCTNFASNGAPSENQANSKVQAKPTKVEKTDYVLLVLLILWVLQCKNLTKLICTEKIDLWSLARWLGGSFIGRKTVARSVVSGRWLVSQLESQSVCQWSMVWFLSVVGSFVIRWRSDSFEHLVHWKNTENINLFCKGLLFEKEEKYKTVWMSSLWK